MHEKAEGREKDRQKKEEREVRFFIFQLLHFFISVTFNAFLYSSASIFMDDVGVPKIAPCLLSCCEGAVLHYLVYYTVAYERL